MAQTDPLPVTVRTTADVVSKRAAIKALIWPPSGSGYPPVTIKPAVTADYQWSHWDGMPNLLRVDRLDVGTNVGHITSWHFRPRNGSGKTMLYLDGHQFGILDRTWVYSNLGGLLAVGYDVVYIPMPLYGVYDPSVTTISGYPLIVNGVTVTPDHYHDDLAPFVGSFIGYPFHYLQWFLIAPIAVLNYLPEATGRPAASAMGISGGGWTAELLASLDERVVRTYPVSSGHPPATYPPGYGIDLEYNATDLEVAVPMQDRYVMATSGGRRVLKLINELEDPFGAGPLPRYAQPVSAAAAGMGGRWEYWIDAQQSRHYISPASLARVIADDRGQP